MIKRERERERERERRYRDTENDRSIFHKPIGQLSVQKSFSAKGDIVSTIDR